MGIKHIRRELFVAVLSVMVAFVAISSSTYAWFISNTTVRGTTSTISAKANNFVLQIAALSEGAQHGDNQSLIASSVGHRISPSSTNDLKNWYICQGWGQNGKVQSYTKPSIDSEGKYTIGTDRYAYIKSEYILYTVIETGLCDVYLDGGELAGAIQVSAQGSPTATVIPDSMRVGITIQDLEGTAPTGTEELVLVYAPKNETGKGNDATAIDGWTYVKDENTLAAVTYPYIYENHYKWIDSSSQEHDYAAVKTGETYDKPLVNATPIATDVDYDGVIMRVYIWLEGTDEQCVNNSNEDDQSTYSVTVSLAGVAK